MKKNLSGKTGGSSESSSDYALVYSTDKNLAREKKEEKPTGFSGTLDPRVRIEKKGRGGKTVTVVFNLPNHQTLLEDLCSFLKRSLGAGGTYYIKDGEGFVEIQGERAEKIPDLITRYQSRKKKF